MIKLKDLLESGNDLLNEMPIQYSGDITYQGDHKFTRISLNNFKSYHVLGRDGTFTYMLSSNGRFGVVFLNSDIEKAMNEKSGERVTLLPVLSLELRDSGVKEYMQAYHLRIRKDFARRNVATTWYSKYVDVMGGIVSDSQHLSGGKTLWRSFIDASGFGYNISLYNLHTGKSIPVDSSTSDSEIWSTYKSNEPSKEHLVLIMEK